MLHCLTLSPSVPPSLTHHMPSLLRSLLQLSLDVGLVICVSHQRGLHLLVHTGPAAAPSPPILPIPTHLRGIFPLLLPMHFTVVPPF